MFQILPFIMLSAMGVSFWKGRQKGYSGILFALLAFLFPFMAIIVFFLPDNNEMKRNAQHSRVRAGAESLELRAREEVQRMDTDRLMVYGMENELEGHDGSAMSFYLEAAKRGDAMAQYFCGDGYRKGVGCTADVEQALYWYQKAAEQGLFIAQLECGNLYAGELQDKEKASYWYRKAAEQGNADIQYVYATYTDDVEEARYWLEQAAAQGHEQAKERLEGRHLLKKNENLF